MLILSMYECFDFLVLAIASLFAVSHYTAQCIETLCIELPRSYWMSCEFVFKICQVFPMKIKGPWPTKPLIRPCLLPVWWQVGLCLFNVTQIAPPEVNIQHLYQTSLEQLHTNHSKTSSFIINWWIRIYKHRLPAHGTQLWLVDHLNKKYQIIRLQ